MDCEGGDDDLDGDFVGTVSARLLAAGLPRDQRLGALRLLGALDTLADRDDRVRRPLSQVGAEFDLPGDQLSGWFDALQWVGAVELDQGGIVLAGREQPAGSMRLHDFLAVVAELDDPGAHRRVPALLGPAVAVLVAAALIAAVLLAPGVVRNRTANRPSSAAAPSGGTLTTGGATNRTGTAAGHATAGGSVTAPADVAAGGTTCPTGTPIIEVVDVVSGPATTVRGVIRNAAGQPLSVGSFTVIATVDGHDLPGVPGTSDAIVVPAGGSAPWTTTLPATPAAGTAVRTTLDHWEWRGTATGCFAR